MIFKLKAEPQIHRRPVEREKAVIGSSHNATTAHQTPEKSALLADKSFSFKRSEELTSDNSSALSERSHAEIAGSDPHTRPVAKVYTKTILDRLIDFLADALQRLDRNLFRKNIDVKARQDPTSVGKDKKKKKLRTFE